MISAKLAFGFTTIVIAFAVLVWLLFRLPNPRQRSNDATPRCPNPPAPTRNKQGEPPRPVPPTPPRPVLTDKIISDALAELPLRTVQFVVVDLTENPKRSTKRAENPSYLERPTEIPRWIGGIDKALDYPTILPGTVYMGTGSTARRLDKPVKAWYWDSARPRIGWRYGFVSFGLASYHYAATPTQAADLMKGWEK